MEYHMEGMEQSPLDRVKEITGIRTHIEMCRRFPTQTQASLSDMVRCGYVAFDVLLALYMEGVNPHWIVTGRGQKALPPDKPKIAFALEACPALAPYFELEAGCGELGRKGGRVLEAIGICPCVRKMPDEKMTKLEWEMLKNFVPDGERKQ